MLNTGEKLQCDLCLVGVGARPNLDLFKDHLDMLDDKPGGVKVGPPPVPVYLPSSQQQPFAWLFEYSHFDQLDLYNPDSSEAGVKFLCFDLIELIHAERIGRS